MLLHKSIIQAISREGISGIYFIVKDAKKTEVQKRICEIFDCQWKEKCTEIRITQGDCFDLENRWPSGIDAYIVDSGELLMTFPALYIMYNGGEKCDVHAGMQVLYQTLDLIQEEYPSVEYYGYIGFVDLNGNVHQEEIKSNSISSIERYEFIADAIGRLNKRFDEYIDSLIECCYEEGRSDGKWLIDVFDAFHMYEDKVGTIIYDRILSAAVEYIDSDDIYCLLERKIDYWKNNKRNIGDK